MSSRSFEKASRAKTFARTNLNPETGTCRPSRTSRRVHQKMQIVSDGAYNIQPTGMCGCVAGQVSGRTKKAAECKPNHCGVLLLIKRCRSVEIDVLGKLTESNRRLIDRCRDRRVQKRQHPSEFTYESPQADQRSLEEFAYFETIITPNRQFDCRQTERPARSITEMQQCP